MRVKSLDGIRGFAVLLVLLYHHGYLNSGWLGVDLFFVLSGFLITTILRSTRNDRFFWREFWIKRVTRILPPFLLLLVASLVLMHLPLAQFMGYLCSLGDLLAYLRPQEVVRPLWSLAVEEHFYLLWPFAVIAFQRRTLMILLGAVIVGEPLLRAIFATFHHDWQLLYFLTPFRLDGISLGSLLALCFESNEAEALFSRWSLWGLVGSVACWVGLRFALGKTFTRDASSVAYGSLAYTIVAFSATFLIAHLLTHRDGLLSKLFAWRPLTFTGGISYGLYLYQNLVLYVLVEHVKLPVRKVLVIDAPITFLLAWLSFRYYERPIILFGKLRAEALHEQGTQVRGTVA